METLSLILMTLLMGLVIFVAQIMLLLVLVAVLTPAGDEKRN